MKRIEFFALIISTFLFISSSAHASIIYSGLINFQGPDFNIDINKDGNPDFVTQWNVFILGNGFSQSGYDVEYNSNMDYINTQLTGFPSLPGTKAPLNYGDLIGNTLPNNLLWSSSSNDAMMWQTTDLNNGPPFVTYSGVWNDVQDKYLGFELTENSNSYYGWIELNTDSTNDITLVDYAYEDVPGQFILAGEKNAVPEPDTMLLFGIGLFCIVLYNSIIHSCTKPSEVL